MEICRFRQLNAQSTAAKRKVQEAVLINACVYKGPALAVLNP